VSRLSADPHTNRRIYAVCQAFHFVFPFVADAAFRPTASTERDKELLSSG
jgi:hypothetical protein